MQPEPNPRKKNSAEKLFREFVQKATSPSYKDDTFWDYLRKTTRPTKEETVDEMFARWKASAGIAKKTK